MLKATCASIIAAAALVAVPVAAQAEDYNAGTSMSTDTRGTTGTGDQYMRTQENYTASQEEAYFEETGQRIHNDPRYSGTEQHPRSAYPNDANERTQARNSSLADERHTTGTGDQYMRTQENYTASPEEAYFEATGQSIRNDPRYGGTPDRMDAMDRYQANQQAMVPGSSNTAAWASESLGNQSREGFVGNDYLWDSQRYFPNPSMN